MMRAGNLSLPNAEGDGRAWNLPKSLHPLACRNRGDDDADEQPPCDTHCAQL